MEQGKTCRLSKPPGRAFSNRRCSLAASRNARSETFACDDTLDPIGEQRRSSPSARCPGHTGPCIGLSRLLQLVTISTLNKCHEVRYACSRIETQCPASRRRKKFVECDCSLTTTMANTSPLPPLLTYFATHSLTHSLTYAITIRTDSKSCRLSNVAGDIWPALSLLA